MFDLPKSCVVNKFIPKNIFYKKVTMATSVKKEFINLIEKITWLYKIAPDTLGVNKTDNIEELEIFEIQLKQKQLPKNVIKVITKSISYPILFVIKYNNDFCYSAKVEKNYYSDWNENITFDFNYCNTCATTIQYSQKEIAGIKEPRYNLIAGYIDNFLKILLAPQVIFSWKTLFLSISIFQSLPGFYTR